MHLSQPAQKLIEEFLHSRKVQLQQQQTYSWIANGVNISDVLRGKIQIIDEILDMRGIFTKIESLEKDVKEAEKGAK